MTWFPLLKRGVRLSFAAPEDEEPTFSVPCAMAYFVDDGVIYVEAEEASMLMPKVQVAMRSVTDVYARFGMEINFKYNKSGVVVVFVGTGARKEKARWSTLGKKKGTDEEVCRHAASTASVPICSAMLGQRELFVMREYRYLGGLAEGSGSMWREIHARGGMLGEIRSKVGKTLFANPELPLKARSNVALALAETRLLFGSGAWTALGAREKRHLQGRYNSVRGGSCMPGTRSKDLRFRRSTFGELPGGSPAIRLSQYGG